MWRSVFNHKLDKVNSQAFLDTLRTSHQTSVLVELLDTSFLPVEGGTIFSAERSNELTNFISDGNVDVDRSRGIRRTSELTLLNPSSEFTPATEDFESEGPWTGKIYLNRMVRIYRGVYVGAQPMYVPVGTFLIDIARVISEQNMSMVNLTMSDRYKMLMKSFYGNQRVYQDNALYTEIIEDMIDSAGVPMHGRWGAVIDKLHDRPANERRISGKLKFERGESRGEKLKELCDKWDIDAYFDPMGVFRTQDRRDAADKREVWHYHSSPNGNGMIISLERTFSDDNLYNHVVIIGTGNKKGIVKANRSDNNPRSKTNINLIGDRVFFKESDRINTQHEANKALDRAWKLRFKLIETIDMQAICHPALEADDIIRITERNRVKIDERYRLDRFNIPLITGLQTLQANSVIRKDDL